MAIKANLQIDQGADFSTDIDVLDDAGDVVKLPVTRLDFSWESDVKFCVGSKITIYGIGAK